MNRKNFLRLSGSVVVLLANGKIGTAQNYIADAATKPDVLFRFAVASDGHYGQPDTNYERFFTEVVDAINSEHARHPLLFTVINGDIVHDEKSHFPAAKKALDRLHCKYYVSQGNHDHVTRSEWESTWQMPVNLSIIHENYAFLVATTSNEKGEYLCPDLPWLEEKLDEHRAKKVFIFMHINPGALTKHGIECAELFRVFGSHQNIRGVFNGHDHDEDGIIRKNNIPFIFDAHFGGSWGTSYRGYRIVEVMKDGSIVSYIMNPANELNRSLIT